MLDVSLDGDAPVALAVVDLDALHADVCVCVCGDLTADDREVGAKHDLERSA